MKSISCHPSIRNVNRNSINVSLKSDCEPRKDIMVGTYINPLTHFGFTKIFGDEQNRDLLIDFFNEVLKGYQIIRSLDFKRTGIEEISKRDFNTGLDFYCENDHSEKIIVKLKKTQHQSSKSRTLYSSAIPILEQSKEDGWHYQLKAVYTIIIVESTFDNEYRNGTVVNSIQLMDTERKKVFYDKLTFIYLQMPNFTKTEDQLETRFDKWLYIFKNLQKLHSRPARLQERIFEKLFRIAEIARFSPLEREAYQESLKV